MKRTTIKGVSLPKIEESWTVFTMPKALVDSVTNASMSLELKSGKVGGVAAIAVMMLKLMCGVGVGGVTAGLLALEV